MPRTHGCMYQERPWSRHDNAMPGQRSSRAFEFYKYKFCECLVVQTFLIRYCRLLRTLAFAV